MMRYDLNHAMQPMLSTQERARQNFVIGLRDMVLNDLSDDMRFAYDSRVAPAFERKFGRSPQSGPEVHKSMRGDPMFTLYSALRVKAQRMVYDSVVPVVERDKQRLEAYSLAAQEKKPVEIDADLPVPRNVSALEVHLMPGGYLGESSSDDIAVGAIYDQGLSVFACGLMGENYDDIGRSMARYISRKFPDFDPRHILDLGCTIGHNSLPWARQYPEATVDAIDVAAPGLFYGNARAHLQGVDNIRFRQMDASSLSYEDESVDLVFSSMFLHELSLKTTAAVFREARRVLKPGGLMLHMELPPNPQMGPYESFYLDWDSYYNNEPFYKTYRDQEPKALCEQAGFAPEDYIQFVVPSLGLYGDAITDATIDADSGVVNSDKTGRLADGIQWFGFGAWKR